MAKNPPFRHTIPLLWLALVGQTPVLAAPHVPADDAVILERLPGRTSDENARTARALRAQLGARPNDAEIASALAHHYYRLAQREGDPRYVGYAQAVLAPWSGQTEPPSRILVVRALLAQFVHDFSAAERDLTRVLERDPGDLAARSYRAILRLVQARYSDALSDCQDLAGRARGLIVTACGPTVQAVTGGAKAAYAQLSAALSATPDAPANERFWVLTRLAEIAVRLGQADDAERHFRTALQMGIVDQYLLATYAEFLLDTGRPGEVIALLREQTRNDVLLLRLALAEKAIGAPSLADHVETLGARFEAARRRGDELHLADEAVFELHFRKQAASAVRLARRNWDSGQREPADARTLLETAIAAGDRAVAAPALEWLLQTRHEDPRLLALARQLDKAAR